MFVRINTSVYAMPNGEMNFNVMPNLQGIPLEIHV